MISLPSEYHRDEINRTVVSSALEMHRPANRRKVAHVRELNDQGRFNLVPIKEKSKKPTRVITDNPDSRKDDWGRRSYFE